MALSDNLIAAWELDEASGNALDSHGSNDLTDTNTVGSGTGLVNATARDFEESSNEYFALNDNTDLSTGDIDFTFEAWFKLESSGANRTVLGKWGTPQREYTLRVDNFNRFLFAVSSDGSNAITASADTFGTAADATWYQVIGWHDSVNNQVGISVNNSTPDLVSHSGGVLDSTTAFRIGDYVENNHFFDGLIGPVRFWKRVLTSDERTELYNAGSGRDYAYITAGGGNRRRRALLAAGS